MAMDTFSCTMQLGIYWAHGGQKAWTSQKGSHFLGLRKKPYEEHVLPFGKGDLLALYTDGMIEAQDKSGADYTARRLHAIIESHRELPMQEILTRCQADYQQFRHADSDDCTLILVRRKS